ncbi:MAG: hypothetical protein IKW46_07170 [Bacteroidaceae bacterium]|nr:hypothetical protein [Bacteroidaceae bacterium]
MKQKKLFSYLLLAISFTLFTACTNEDEVQEVSFSAPEYEDISAKYEITDSSSNINSLELTASGNYIVTNNYYIYNSKAYRNTENNKEFSFLNKTVLKINGLSTRASAYGNIIYGKFTALGENRYDLEGYGIVTITTDSENAYTLDIALENGNTVSIGARKEKTYESSNATNNLCRSWSIEKFGFKVQAGPYKFEKLVDDNNIEQLFLDYFNWIIKISGEEYDEEEIAEMKAEAKNIAETYNSAKPLSLIFTKSGSYMVDYNNGAIGISTWKWEDESKGILRYSWNTQDIEDEYIGGTVNISYLDNMLMISENVENDVEEGLNVTITYGMKEIK